MVSSKLRVLFSVIVIYNKTASFHFLTASKDIWLILVQKVFHIQRKTCNIEVMITILSLKFNYCMNSNFYTYVKNRLLEERTSPQQRPPHLVDELFTSQPVAWSYITSGFPLLLSVRDIRI